jgi:hypothetical protein
VPGAEAKAVAAAVEELDAAVLRRLGGQAPEPSATASDATVACLLPCGGDRSSADLLGRVPGMRLLVLQGCSGVHWTAGLCESGPEAAARATLPALEQLRTLGPDTRVVSACRHAARAAETLLRGRTVRDALELVADALPAQTRLEAWQRARGARSADAAGPQDGLKALEAVLRRQRELDAEAAQPPPRSPGARSAAGLP